MHDPDSEPQPPPRDPPPIPPDGQTNPPPYELEELEEMLGEDGTILIDLPCVRCGHNLRGIYPDRNCPECGARVGKSLDFAMERVLCPTCLAPNHPAIPVCSNCHGPMNAAAATSNYFRTMPMHVHKKKTAPPLPDEEDLNDDEEEESVTPSAKPPPLPPSIGMAIIAWILGLPFTIFFASQAAKIFPEDPPFASIFAGLALLFFGMAIVQTSRYLSRRKRYRHEIAFSLENPIKPESPTTDDHATM